MTTIRAFCETLSDRTERRLNRYAQRHGMMELDEFLTKGVQPLTSGTFFTSKEKAEIIEALEDNGISLIFQKKAAG